MENAPRSANASPESQLHAPRVAQARGAGSLPVFLTSFVDREDEIALARSLLRRPDVRLLTLTGPGGIGKTRLAVEIAAESGTHFPDGVLFLSLTAVQDPSMVMLAIATALGLHEFDGSSIDDIVAASLAASTALLVVDNFEHVLTAAPALTTMLSRCPGLTIMVTSRRLLRVEGEYTIPVPPLLLPKADRVISPDDWLRVPVIRLFIERAAAVNPSLAWPLNDILQLVEICGRLDGLPLAVELAATRMRHFSLEEINDRLNDLMPLLTDGSRDHPSRLQTMRNAIAWSYDLLVPEAQALLRVASVFSGGFTLDAIVSVSIPPDGTLVNRLSTAPESQAQVTADDVTGSIEDLLAVLIDSSLLVREAGPIAGTTRYRMLETIREYAWEQLEQHGDVNRARRAHAVYFTGYAAQHEIVELTPEHVQAMDQVAAEQDNLRSALIWLYETSDEEILGQLVATLGRFWLAQSSYQEGQIWFERALAMLPAPATAESARILVCLGMAEIFQGENAAAEMHLARGEAACRAHGEAHSAAQALIGLAGLAVARGETGRSTQLLAEAQEVITALPDARLVGIMSGWVAINLAVAARTAGDGEAAKTHIQEALIRFRAEHFHVGMMMAFGDLGDLALDRGDWSQALSLYKEALDVERTDQAKRIMIEIIESVAMVASHSGHLDHSVVLLGAAEGVRKRIGLRYRQPQNRTSLKQVLDAARRGLPAATFSTAWDTGESLTLDQAIATVRAVNVSAARSLDYALTPREAEILRLLATGMTDPDIANALFLSVRTVEHHVAHVYRKLGVRTRAAATSTAIAAGLVAARESA